MTLQLTKKHDFDIVFDSQKVFRHILDVMSNPGKTVNIRAHSDKLSGSYAATIAIAMTLLDNEVSFNTCGNHVLESEITSLTLAGPVSVQAADFIFVSDMCHIENVIENAKCGILTDPHKSATILIQNDDEPVCRVMLSGPGIDKQAEIMLTQLARYTITKRDEQNYEYPQGIDLLFITGAGDLFAIPRLTRMEVL